MRLVDDPAVFERAFDAARREATQAFGDDTVYIEKAIVRPRHVEVQVFADGHGHVVHLGERDCSIQRRHQKVIEESPSPVVSDALRQSMGECAVRATRACDYLGAGTIEFLLDASGSFYFLEMNTRLQVEHPVTEMVYGLDLVAWQIQVARGQELPLDQAAVDARRRGAAVECRVYAEDPERFLPSPGVITTMRTPEGPNIRNDSGAYQGLEISRFYDPLISKLVAWGETRMEAIGRMQRALSEYTVAGISTNLPFHRRVLAHDGFRAGSYDTSFVEREAKALTEHAMGPEEVEAGAICEAVRRASTRVAQNGPGESSNAPMPSAWRRGGLGGA
jgi:acetyl-CoA carboxylase biotin carboxylase subunit